jgi:hypothetical protein
MSRTDHHGAKRPYNPFAEIDKSTAKRYMNARDAIAEQLRNDSPVRAIVEPAKPTKRVKIQHFVPSDTRIGTLREGSRNPRMSEGFVPRAGARKPQFANLDVETPSLMQMAKAREAQILRDAIEDARYRLLAQSYRRQVEQMEAERDPSYRTSLRACGLVDWECELIHGGWREIALSDCDHGCKVYERVHYGFRETQVQHSSVYGCKLGDGPIITREMVSA